MIFKLKQLSFGPATLVAAAFIGPGTVVTASLAGANFGYALLWALVFSVLATMILQEMAARLGVVTQQGLGEAIRSQLENPALKWFAIALVIAAVVIGNSVYQGATLLVQVWAWQVCWASRLHGCLWYLAVLRRHSCGAAVTAYWSVFSLRWCW